VVLVTAVVGGASDAVNRLVVGGLAVVNDHE
jgi:hypothetical protein